MNMPPQQRLVSGASQPEDMRDKALRPLSFDEFVGQDSAVDNLKIFVQAAGLRGKLWIMSSFMGLPGLVRPRWHTLLPGNLG